MYFDDILVVYYVGSQIFSLLHQIRYRLIYIGNDIVRFEKQIILLENILFALIKLHNKTVFSLHKRN